MIDKNVLEKVIDDLMFYGCQKLTVPMAEEIAESILGNKLPSLPVNTPEKSQTRAEGNIAATAEAMSKFMPEKSSKEAFQSEVKHWHKVFVAASLGDGRIVSESIEIADIAIKRLYGDIDFELHKIK